MSGAALPVGGMAAARSLASSRSEPAPVTIGSGDRCTSCGARLRRFGVIDPAGPPGECRVTTGSVCPNCSLVSDEGAVVSRVPDVELVEAEPWPPADLGGGDA